MNTHRHSKTITALGGLLFGLLVFPQLARSQGAPAPVVTPALKRAPSGKLVSVVVYKNRAQATRVGTARCATGMAEFGELPSTLDPKTLRAVLPGGGEVIGVTYKTEVTGPRGDAKDLLKKLRALSDRVSALYADQRAATANESKLSSFRQHLRRLWSLAAGGKKAPVKRWNAALDLLRKEKLAARQRHQAAGITLRKLHREKRELRRQLRQIRRKRRRTTYRAKVLLRCQGNQRVRLSYVVPGATWRIAYQARTDMQARRVTLVAQAIVQQGTGEDWNNVRLAVSTANLRRSNLPPTVRRMNVRTRKPYSRQKVLARRFERRRHLKGRGSKNNMQVNLPATTGKAGSPDPGLAMQLTAAGRATVPADGRAIAVTLAKVTRKADYGYETVPKLFPYVYHRVRLNNPFAFPMLPGPIAVYRDGDFKARTRTKLRAAGEPIALSLGIDNQLQVKRWVKKEKRHKAGTFGSSQRLVHRYLIEVGNWTKRARTIIVKENIPVSQVKEIKISLDGQATQPTRWNKKDGIVEWQIKVPSRAKRKIVIAYTVSLPKSYRVTGYR